MGLQVEDGARRTGGRATFVRRLPWIGLSIAAVVVAGCQLLSGVMPAADRNVPHPYPAGCAVFDLSPRRCTLIVEELARRDGISVSDATSIDLLGDPGCQDSSNQPCVRTTSFVVRVRFSTSGGATREESVFCSAGGQYSILCTETPEIELILPLQNGYRDVPCNGEPERTATAAEQMANQTIPPTCPTPFPSPDPTTAAAEQPLLVPSMDIPIDHVGAYHVALGQGTLANGILEVTSMKASDPHPSSFFLRGGIWLELTSLKPGGLPFDNYFLHGRVEGTEPFSAQLTFEVMAFDPGAVLRIRDVVIR
jgi:hypothetical protein